MTLLCGAENIGYLPRNINLAKIIEDEDKISELEFKHINMAAMYILARVTSSQCMGLAGSGFKNMKASRSMMARRFTALPHADPPLDELPYITRQTVAYALSLVMSCVCYSVNDPMTKGRATQIYEKTLANYSRLSDKEFQNVLRANLSEWVLQVTAPEPPGPEVAVMSLQQVAAADRARPSSAAPAATDEGRGGGAAPVGDKEADEEDEGDEEAGTADGAADGDGAAEGDDGSDDGGTSSQKATSSPGRRKRGNNPKKPTATKAKPKARKPRGG